ncbi:MAG: hypothetical protein AB7E80_15635 [Hyphomicrobiaceae bacterium]
MSKRRQSSTSDTPQPRSVSAPIPNDDFRDAEDAGWPGGHDQRAANRIQMRSSALYREAALALDRIETKHELSMPERIALREALAEHARAFHATGGNDPNPYLPTETPERWSERDGRKENPIAFIRRVYAEWLNRGLTRAHLLTIDRPLYTALAVWMHRHPDDEFPELAPSQDELFTRREQKSSNDK